VQEKPELQGARKTAYQSAFSYRRGYRRERRRIKLSKPNLRLPQQQLIRRKIEWRRESRLDILLGDRCKIPSEKRTLWAEKVKTQEECKKEASLSPSLGWRRLVAPPRTHREKEVPSAIGKKRHVRRGGGGGVSSRTDSNAGEGVIREPEAEGWRTAGNSERTIGKALSGRA